MTVLDMEHLSCSIAAAAIRDYLAEQEREARKRRGYETWPGWKGDEGELSMPRGWDTVECGGLWYFRRKQEPGKYIGSGHELEFDARIACWKRVHTLRLTNNNKGNVLRALRRKIDKAANSSPHVQRKFYRVTDASTVAVAKDIRAQQDRRRKAILRITPKGWDVFANGSQLIFRPKEKNTEQPGLDWVRAPQRLGRNLWRPSKRTDAGKALNTKIAELPKADTDVKLLEMFNLPSMPMYFANGRTHYATVVYLDTEEAAYFNVPVMEYSPDVLEAYAKLRKHDISRVMDHNLDQASTWKPRPEMAEIKEWQMMEAIDKHNEIVTAKGKRKPKKGAAR
jgi:hypothetical protein